MIRLAEQMEPLLTLCADSPFGCQILSCAQAYGMERPFAQFWTDGGAAYGKLDGVMRIAGDIADAGEARGFLRAVGAGSVFCGGENAARLGLSVQEQGAVLKKVLSGETSAPETVSIQALYAVLKETGMASDFEPFYLDLSHRLRHGTARCAALYDTGKMIATASAVLGGEAALITAVAVLPGFQRRGFGKAVMRKIEAQLGARTAYVLRAAHENERFYASLGYTPCGTWCAGILE